LNKNKGQFSIIAALFVAVVLIATVIITYSTIRNSPIQDAPQVLSAIDETNLALKQILGFTIGYYGSVLQVTGNSTYAKMLATRYLQSGLENIAVMHPEWGTSFNVSKADMYTYWFTNTSYSTGNLAVNYSLTGLGMYGITYEASCRLTVYVENTTSSDQTRLMITRDEDEPLINLGKQNFKFYRYVYTDSKWELVNPSSEPVAFANGTYLIDIPPGVDSYSYIIQVEDSRGIIVVASSFSRYTCALTWNPEKKETKYAVAGSASQILNAPDGSYATIGRQATCEVTDYQGGTATIKEVYFNVAYYGSVSGTLEWYYQLDGGSWNKIEDLPEGGSAMSPLTRTYSATSLRASWTWNNLNATHIRFKNNGDNSSENAYVDAIYVTVLVQTADVYSTLQDATVVVELLQNGTMRWLGQNLQLTTQAKPVPPIPVKAIHVSQTINGVNCEVSFQIEDWASEYRIPLGLTNNASVFNSRTMLVFLANSKVSKVTIWWNGSDTATQTSLAYTNIYFSDSPSTRTLNNGRQTLRFSASGFTLTSTTESTTSTARLMGINYEYDNTDPELAYVIYNGVVRDIVLGEAEWSGGANNCPNVYSNIVITLPANVTYYTYQLRLMFINSQQQRTITNLCPIQLSTFFNSIQTENGTANGFPIVTSGSGTFYNYSGSGTPHHWSQFISGERGAGIMFTDSTNQKLYIFDTIAGSKVGALRADAANRRIELLPVASGQVQFKFALDVTWYGAVVTFDDTTPIYNSSNESGLWIIVEYPPTITVTTES